MKYTSLYQMDIDRVKFTIASYLRVRLAKIKEQVMFLLPAKGVKNPLLSVQEQRFAERYKDLKFMHFNSSGLSQLPAEFCGALNEREMGV